MITRSMSISKKILIFNSVVVLLVAIITAGLCLTQSKKELTAQADDSQDKRLKIMWNMLQQKGSDFNVTDNRLMVGNYVINDNFEIPDRLKDLSGGVATIFMNDTRVSTNIVGPDGKRAIGTKLQGAAYDAIFKDKKSFRGEAVILNEDYLTAYDPIKDSKGNIVGVLFVGVKKSDYFASFTHLVIWIIALTALLCVVSGIINHFVVQRLLGPLTEAADVVTKVAEGDLSVRIEARSDDEIGKVMISMEKMVKNLKEIISQVKSSAESMAAGSEQLRTSSERISTNVADNASQANQIAASSEEMSQTVIDIAKNSSNIAASSSEAAQTARSGEDVVSRSVEETEKIAIAVNESSEMMKSLGERSKEIGAIVEVIKDIADQTNLLALNAAIEAARAGEQGRGFAVVADEVRKLAERTAKSTAQISEMIGAIQQEVDKAVESMDGASRRVEVGVSLSQEAGSALTTIVHSVNELQGMVQQIASATEEMSSVSEQISSDIQSIAASSKESAQGSTQITQSSSELARIAASLRNLVSRFKI